MPRILVIAAEGPEHDAPASASLPHAPFLHFVDADGSGHDAIPNPAAKAKAHFGMVVAKAILAREVHAVVGHRMGPHPVQAFASAGVAIHQGLEAVSVLEVVRQWKEGLLPRVDPEAMGGGHHHGHGHDHC